MTTYSASSPSGRVGILQAFTVPNDGFYRIEAQGAEGGTTHASGQGGRGGIVSGTFQLTANDILWITVGQQGVGSGGGGASTVALDNGSGVSSSTPLLVGAGGGSTGSLGRSGVSSDATVPGPSQTVSVGLSGGGGTAGGGGGQGGTGGNGGWSSANTYDSADLNGAGGGGFFTRGGNGNAVSGSGGHAFVDTPTGGLPTNIEPGQGGYGGGGGGNTSFVGGVSRANEAGGGGGYNGGGGGAWPVNSYGGGGGSYNTGTDPVNTAGEARGAGRVVVTQITPEVFGPNVTLLSNPGETEVTVCWDESIPNDWQDDEAVMATIERIDCYGRFHLATITDGLSGCFIDRFPPLRSQRTCGAEHDCELTYEVRYHGYVIAGRGVTPAPIPSGIIFGWRGEPASIPSGWTRQTTLDSRYVRAIASPATNPNTAGGSDTHTHTTQAHSHTIGAHSHSNPSGTRTGSGGVSVQGYPYSQPNINTSGAHTHLMPDTNSAGPFTSGTSSPSAGAGSSLVKYHRGVFLRSDGTQNALPVNTVGLFGSVPPTGWEHPSSVTNGAFWRGAATGQGSAGETPTPAHTHPIAAHTHTGVSHTHTSPRTGEANLNAGSIETINPSSPVTYHFNWHAHPITVNSASTGNLASNTATTGSVTLSDAAQPPWVNARMVQRATGDGTPPIGIIGMWLGSLASIPSGWVLCDGTNGTPNLSNGRYVRHSTVNVGSTGGGGTHAHGGASHTHSIGSHTHTRTIGNQSPVDIRNASTFSPSRNVLSSASHTHTAPNAGAATPAIGSSVIQTNTATVEPAYRTVAFIQLRDYTFVPYDVPVWSVSDVGINSMPILDNPTPGNAWVKHPVAGELSVCLDESASRTRPFGATQNVSGGAPVIVSGATGGTDFYLRFVVRSEDELVALEHILDAPLFHYTDPDGRGYWLAPDSEQAEVVKVGQIRTLSVPTIEVDAQPPAPALEGGQ